MAGREILQDNICYLQGLRDWRPVEHTGLLTDVYRATHDSNLRVAGIGR